MATTVKYGISGQLERAFDGNYTIGDLLADRQILGALGAGDNVVAIAGGEQLANSELVSHYGSISLEKAAASKAA